MVKCYQNDILKYFRPKNKVIKQIIQDDINEKMRQILIDWLIEVHRKFKLQPETLFSTINIIDIFLEKKQISRNKFQLLGVTSLFISSKFHEIEVPHIKNFVYITDNSYTIEELIIFEGYLL